jgi:hypothetical protein
MKMIPGQQHDHQHHQPRLRFDATSLLRMGIVAILLVSGRTNQKTVSNILTTFSDSKNLTYADNLLIVDPPAVKEGVTVTVPANRCDLSQVTTVYHI